MEDTFQSIEIPAFQRTVGDHKKRVHLFRKYGILEDEQVFTCTPAADGIQVFFVPDHDQFIIEAGGLDLGSQQCE